MARLTRGTLKGIRGRSLCLAGLAIGTTWLTLSGPSQVAGNLIVRLDNYRSVVRYREDGKVDRVLYDEGTYIRSVVVSSDGRFVAFREKTRRDFFAPYRLVVVDGVGNIVRLFTHNVHVLTWCCGLDRLAVISGEVVEGGLRFRPEDVLILNVVTGEELALPQIPRPYQLHWADFDASLYVRSGVSAGSVQVYRYDPRRGELYETSRLGVFFSPDGRYYFDDHVEGSFGLYRSVDDSEISGAVPEEVRGIPNPYWAPGAGHVLVLQKLYYPADVPRAEPLGRPERGLRQRTYLLNVETQEIVERAEGVFSRWSTNMPVIPVFEDSQFRLLRVSQP